MKMKFRIVLAVVLAVIMAVITPMQTLAYSQDVEQKIKEMKDIETLEKEVKNKTICNYLGATKLYVSEVKLESATTEAAAKLRLRDAGYLVYDCDLNDGSDPGPSASRPSGKVGLQIMQNGPKRYTYLGYKLTTDRNKAITNLNVMDEYGGYESFSYETFAKNKMPGLQNTIRGIKASCAEMKRKLDAGSYAAKVAKEYLDMFCVPAKSTGTEGPKLGDWLLNETRKDEELRDMLLVLNTLMLNVINSMLALGNSDSEIVLKTANGGKNEDGTVAATYTSRNGITGYTELTENGNWLQNAAVAMTENAEFANVSKTNDSEFFAEQMSLYGAQIAMLKRAFDEGTLSSAAVTYLKSTQLEANKGAIGTVLGTENTTAYDLLTKGSERMLCLFLAELPEICGAHRFVDALEICATDCQHRLPVKYTYERKYDISWAAAVVDAIDEEMTYPSDKAYYDTYNTEIESFVKLFQQFVPDYEKAIADYEKDPEKPIMDSDADTLEEAKEVVASAIENQEKVDPASYIYYVALRDYFAPYTVLSGVGDKRVPLLDYLVAATKDASPTDVAVKARIYPIVKTLGNAGNYSHQSLGTFTFLLYSTLGTDEFAGMEAKLTQSRMKLENAFESKCLSIWYNSNKDLSESEKASGIAVTSRGVISTLNSMALDEAFPKKQPASEEYKEALTDIAYIAMGVVAAGLIVYAVVEIAVAIGGFSALSGLALLAALFTTACGVIAFVGCLLLVVATVAVFFMSLVALVFAMLLFIATQTENAAPNYSMIPDIMLDGVKDVQGHITSICRYDVVKDTQGAPADINGFKGKRWNALYYTKDPAAGSPLTLGENGEFFSFTKGTIKQPDKSVPLAKFLGTAVYDLNFHCYYNRVSGIYLYYYTEDSLAGKERKVANTGKYIESIVIGHSTSDEGTRAYVQMTSGYQVFSVNLSPDSQFNTFIAYTTTDNPQDAITDIRAAHATTAKTIRYGDNDYEAVLGEDMRKVPQVTCEDDALKQQTTGFAYGLYCSTSTRVGDPLLAAGFGYVDDLSLVPEDADVISYFAGVPLNFNAWEGEKNDDTSNGSHTFDEHYYVYFKSERDSTVDYESNTYLAGMAFFAGSEDLYDEDDTAEYNVKKYAENSYGCTLFGENLTPGLYYDEEDVMRIGYVTTHNPKRALTELAVFTSEPKSTMLPQNIAVANDGYCSCEVFTQGDGHFYGENGGSTQRMTRYSHTYFTAEKSEYYYWFGWPKLYRILPQALYGCGPQADVGPIKLEDVVFSTTSNLPPTNSRENGCVNLKRLTVDGVSDDLKDKYLGYNWHSVHDICQSYYDTYDDKGELQTSYDIGLGMNKDDDCVAGTEYYGSGSLYIYYRNGTGPRTRKTYVSDVSLCGSISEDSAYNDARYDALSRGDEIVNITEPMTAYGEVFDLYEKLVNGGAIEYDITNDVYEAYQKYSSNCYFLAVTYTDDPMEALGAVRILNQNEKEAELDYSMELPLYDPNIRTAIFTQSNLALTSGKKGTQDVDVHDESGKKTGTIKGATYSGYATYTSHNGTPINRVDVRFVRTAAGPQAELISAASGNGSAEYYAQRDDTLEPFLMDNVGLGTSACLCLQRGLDENGKNSDNYIMRIKVIEGISYDGNMTLTATELGALGCPYLIDFDLAEGNLSKSSNTVVALGVERTSSPSLALKDIRVSDVDLGATYAYNGMQYDRVNDKPLLLEGTAKDGVYIYTTNGSDPYAVIWSDIKDKENVDWEHFDWEHLDVKKSKSKDKTFLTQVLTVLANCSPEVKSYVETLCSDEYSSIVDATKLNWSKQYAITNIGFAPGGDCWMQWFRQLCGVKKKDIYWAGCNSYSDDKLPVPVTDSTTVFAVPTFENTESLSGLRVTNASNSPLVQYVSPIERIRTEQSASVFSEKNIVVMAVLSGIFVIGLAAVFVLYRKKKKPGKVGKVG